MPTPWEPATVTAIHDETSTTKTFRFRLTHPSAHLPGQHYILRLTAPDGYRATRSYSVASAPDGSGEVDLTIERLPDGEVPFADAASDAAIAIGVPFDRIRVERFGPTG